ncbi:MAG: DUF2059 domain-containing protein [Pyrinomonadaceae bacterium]|nr:DUF2059 domain-containing protein [Pyrinomonadaceae bacterium]
MRKSLLLAIAVLFCVGGLSQSVKPQTTISEEKTRLIAELIKMSQMDAQMPQMVDATFNEIEKNYRAGFDASLDKNSSLSGAEKAILKKVADERVKIIGEKFRTRAAERVDYGKFIQETAYPLYDKLFTEEDLKGLITFYASPTGKKMISAMPELWAESQRMGREKLGPIFTEIITEIFKEEAEDRAGKATEPGKN